MAFNIEDRVYLGLTLGAYDVNYKRYSYYTEDIFYYPENDPDYGEDVGYYEMTNWFETKGTGIDLKLGLLPVRLKILRSVSVWRYILLLGMI